MMNNALADKFCFCSHVFNPDSKSLTIASNLTGKLFVKSTAILIIVDSKAKLGLTTNFVVPDFSTFSPHQIRKNNTVKNVPILNINYDLENWRIG